MPTNTFTSGRIRTADYDPASRQLDLRQAHPMVPDTHSLHGLTESQSPT